MVFLSLYGNALKPLCRGIGRGLFDIVRYMRGLTARGFPARAGMVPLAHSVWTGRVLQAECDDLEMTGLAHLYSTL
jgi:hypothetical protein